MSVVSVSADNEYVMGSRRGDLHLGPTTFWLISFCCSFVSPLCRIECDAVVVVVGFASNVKKRKVKSKDQSMVSVVPRCTILTSSSLDARPARPTHLFFVP